MGLNRPEVVLDPLIQKNRGAERMEATQNRGNRRGGAAESEAAGRRRPWKFVGEEELTYSQMWMWVLLQLWFVSYTGSLHARDKGQGRQSLVTSENCDGQTVIQSSI